ncbi:MAG: glycoside hydrolase family 43 protein [Saprospiraceae bacterium]|nr:glycoside hydrolase family 43 protein [Saprospiraceae bacterium]
MKKQLCQLFVLLIPIFGLAQSTFTNPIIRGGHPDPSICRVGDDFYIVNSSFEYFPGLPIHHSKDLVNWELIGYGLHRAEQASGVVNLVDVQQDGGIHAPSIRYHDGLFYIIVTNVYSPKDKSKPAEMVNFIITAENPAGPWSEPHHIEGAPGIDPDIFFDDDGKVWFVGTHAPDQPYKNGIGQIWVQELDLDEWKLKGERHSLWKGACGGCCVEGPHIYKQHGKYYMLVAEGGTGRNHAVMMACSDSITGPYESNPRNPILTSRHLSDNNWVHSTGHADLVEAADGRWFMVALGKRNDRGGDSNMGRETHLMPVVWEPAIARWEEVRPGVWEPVKYLWPGVAPETGKVERSATPLPYADKPQYYNDAFTTNFDGETLDLEWNFRRVPMDNMYSLTANQGHLRLNLQPQTFSLRERFSAIGFRQKESDFEFVAKMLFRPQQDKEEAGVSMYLQDNNYIHYTVEQKEGVAVLQLKVKAKKETEEIVKQMAFPDYAGSILLKVVSRNNQYTYTYSLDDGKSYTPFATTKDNLLICTSYIGANLGLYASSNGEQTTGYADFDWVKYAGFVKQ